MWGNDYQLPEEQLPEGIIGQNTGDSYSADRVGPYSSLTPASGRTFEVTPHFEKLTEVEGVRFSVEDVTPASKNDTHYQVLGASHLKRTRLTEAKAFYSSGENQRRGYQVFNPMRIEAESAAAEQLVYTGSQAFLHTCLTSFGRHLPLALKPDHIWSLITYGFAKHVDQNAEALRANFVQHQGKKRLEVSIDHFVMGGGVEGAGTPAELWERDVFPDFSRQIREHIGESVHSAIAGDFSTSDNVSRAAQEIVLMSAMKNYFSYGCTTCCGIPSVSLHGSREDWVSLRGRAEQLGALMLPEFAKKWLGNLLPVLDQFIASYDGQVDHGFWQSMVKLRDTGGGSGSYSFISGWIQLFYPYLASGRENGSMRPWNQMFFDGPQLDEFPPISSSAPVDWDYYGQPHNMHFHAGFAGMVQDPQTGEIMPVLGWSISHDPAQDSQGRLTQIGEEVEALLAGHAGEAEEGPWFHRITMLRNEQMKVELAATATERQALISEVQKKTWEYGLSAEEKSVAKQQLQELQTAQGETLHALENA